MNSTLKETCKMTPVLRIVVSITTLLCAATAQADGDAQAGKQKSQACQACHGADGNKTIDGTYPKLANQYESYLSKSLTDYKTGARKNAIMAGFATTLSAQDIDDLAAFYAAQPGELQDLSHLK